MDDDAQCDVNNDNEYDGENMEESQPDIPIQANKMQKNTKNLINNQNLILKNNPITTIQQIANITQHNQQAAQDKIDAENYKETQNTRIQLETNQSVQSSAGIQMLPTSHKTNQDKGHVLFGPATSTIQQINFAINASNKAISDINALDIFNQANFFGLHSLDLSLNKFTQIPLELNQFKKLKILKLDSNFIRQIDPAIFSVLRVETFSIMNNLIKSIPEEIQQWQFCLQTLNLAKNHIENLPDALFKLKKLKVLIVSSNDFESIPYEFYKLKSSLKEFAIDWYKYCQPQLSEISKGDKLSKIFEILEDLKSELNFEDFLEFFSDPEKYDPQKIYQTVKLRNQMHECVLSEDMAALRQFIKINPYLSSQGDADGHTPLSLAIREEKYFCAKILLFGEVDVNLGGGPLGSCLSLAIIKLQFYLVRDLVKFGANVNQSDGEGNTPLHYLFAIFNKDPTEAQKLGDLLLQNKADPNLTNQDGWSPIHIAVKKGSLDALKFIINFNKKVQQSKKLRQQQQQMQLSPLNLRVQKTDSSNLNQMSNQNTEIYQDLIPFQIDKSGGNSNQSILYLAALNGFTELVSYLLDKCPETFSRSMAVNIQINMSQKHNTIQKLMKIAEKKFVSRHVLKLNQKNTTNDYKEYLQQLEKGKQDIKDLDISRKRPPTPFKPKTLEKQQQPNSDNQQEFLDSSFDEGSGFIINNNNSSKQETQSSDFMENHQRNLIEEFRNLGFQEQNSKIKNQGIFNRALQPDNVSQTLEDQQVSFTMSSNNNNQNNQNISKKLSQQQQNLEQNYKESQNLQDTEPFDHYDVDGDEDTTGIINETPSLQIAETHLKQNDSEYFDQDDLQEENEWPMMHCKGVPYITEKDMTSWGISTISSSKKKDREIKNVKLQNQNTERQIQLLISNLEICKEIYEIISSEHENKFTLTNQFQDTRNINDKIDCNILQCVIVNRFPNIIKYNEKDNILAQYTIFQTYQNMKLDGSIDNQFKFQHKFLISDSGFESFFPHEQEVSVVDDSLNNYKIEKKRVNPLLYKKYE
ncbi:Ankyrin repeat-containing domain [Pseudocohnilembus persalinus]|uniref:Ankyrin repeat-containing domain n=1 Tax=Pseudocohnilembus persalinus TaxID=266149 RepID=A0A0V0R902_PSEPJ|nr:Ankyrin repeat-containing domain [Pseudocohnilembus persalinus]|eukprot:KRX10961.1 Ankyrin repeat-containing domain [Pseudocohnilembus persalinus]